MLKFRCKRCRKEFSFEQVASYLSLKENLSNVHDLESLNVAIERITKQIKCSNCQSTVYLIGIGDKLLDSEIDLTSAPIEILIRNAIKLVKNGKYSEYKECSSEIISLLLDKPGQLIYLEDPDLIQDAGNALKIIWENVDTSELFDEMINSGNMVAIIGDYTDRAKLLKPTIVDVKPDKETSVYFQSAIDSWLFGLDSASLILCCSVIENLLRQKLCNIDIKLVFKGNPKNRDLKDRDLYELINNAKSAKILDNNESSKAHGIRKLRREAVHRLKMINSSEAHKAIMDTKVIIEKLLKIV